MYDISTTGQQLSAARPQQPDRSQPQEEAQELRDQQRGGGDGLRHCGRGRAGEMRGYIVYSHCVWWFSMFTSAVSLARAGNDQ